MVKIRIQKKCQNCSGAAYLPDGEALDHLGNKYARYRPCPICSGTGMMGHWMELAEFQLMLDQAKCPHQHVSSSGGFHLTEGICYDDVMEVCDDCGEVLR